MFAIDGQRGRFRGHSRDNEVQERLQTEMKLLDLRANDG